MARATAQKLAEILGQQVIVENRTGASGSIGAQSVATARPDGYTLLWTTGSELSLKPLLEANLPYDPERDFTPVSLIGVTPVVIAVHPAVPARDIAALIALARADPGRINIGNSGTGGVMHMTAAYFALRAGIEVAHIPYRGSAPSVNDAVAGTVQAVVSGLPPVLAQAREGRLRILAVSTPRRTEAAPEVPTLDEQGLAGFDMSNLVGLVAPRGTPEPVLDALSAAARRAAADAELRATFLRNGADAIGTTREEYARIIAAERARFVEVVRATGLRMN
jgi:tripartite-type tricarboxylate transporter receptor subunit TctC